MSRYIFCVFGAAGYVHSDRGAGFISKKLSNWLLKPQVGHTQSTVRNRKGNGTMEHFGNIIAELSTIVADCVTL